MFAIPLSSRSTLASPPGTETRPAVLRPLLDACGLGWFCLRAAGRREHLAALNLARRNAIEAFAPRIRVRRELRAGGVRTVTEALFPGYLFARFQYPAQVRHVVSTTDVLGVVAFGGPPPRLDDATIAHLRQWMYLPEGTGTMFTRVKVTKWGIPLLQITESFHKVPGPAPLASSPR